MERRQRSHDVGEGRVFATRGDHHPRHAVVVDGGHDEDSEVPARDGGEPVEVEAPANLRVHLEAQTEDEPVVGEHHEIGDVVAQRSHPRRGDDHGAARRVASPHPREPAAVPIVGQSRGFAGALVPRQHPRNERPVLRHITPAHARELGRVRAEHLQRSTQSGELHELEVALDHGVFADVRGGWHRALGPPRPTTRSEMFAAVPTSEDLDFLGC